MDMKAMSPEEKKETQKEAKILQQLNHPNIVKFKDVYTTKKGKLCIIMEYADGNAQIHAIVCYLNSNWIRWRLIQSCEGSQRKVSARKANSRLVHSNLSRNEACPWQVISITHNLLFAWNLSAI